MTSKRLDWASWQDQQTDDQIRRLVDLLGRSDAPQEDKARGLKTIAHLKSPEYRDYVASRNEAALRGKE